MIARLKSILVAALFALMALPALSLPALAQPVVELETGIMFEWDGTHNLTVFSHGDIRMQLTLEYPPDSKDWIDGARLEVTGAGEPFTLWSEAGLGGYGQIGVFPIDRQGGLSIIFGAYTGGAHCCMNTISAWLGGDDVEISQLGYSDGGTVQMTDFDGDGFFEFDMIDEGFLYTFDSYAGSFGPVMVLATEGGAFVDLTNEKAFRPAIKDDMAYISPYCGGDEGWFADACAALAADAARIGQYQVIRQTIANHLETGSFDSGWDEFSFCPDEECEETVDYTSFVEALDFALERWGYL